MRLWIDDIREPPDDGEVWAWVKTSAEALEAMEDIEFSIISLDHDLGGDDTAMPVAKWIEEQAHEGLREPPRWRIHSANPVGRKNLEAALTSADRWWEHHTAKADWT